MILDLLPYYLLILYKDIIYHYSYLPNDLHYTFRQQELCLGNPLQCRRWHLGRAGQRGIDAVHFGAQRQDVKKCVEQRVTKFLQNIGRTRIAHKGRAGMAPDDGAGK